jgi:histone deacetylase 1/2
MDLDEAEALLLAHEARLEKSKKKTLDDAASLNLAQASSSKTTPNSQSDSVSTQPSVNSTTSPDSSYFTANRGRGGRNGRGRGRNGGGGRYSNTQCQICFKTGHPAFECWHRSNLQYQPPMNAQYQAGYGAYQANYGPNLGGYGVMQPPALNYNGYGTYFGAPQPNFNPYQPRFPPPARPSTSQVAPPNALLTNTPSVSGSGTWYPDSGASFHVTADARNIQEPSFFDGADQVFIGNGQGLPIHSSGFSVFPSPILPNTQLSLNNLLHVPSITKNLMSVSQFARDNSVYFEFHADYCVVKSQANNAVLLKGNVGTDGLYKFPDLNIQPSQPASNFSLDNKPLIASVHNTSIQCNSMQNLSSSSKYLWHLRLGHPNEHVLKLVLNQCNLSFNNTNKDFSTFCTACCMGKAHRLHSPSSTTTYTQPLELVFSDLWGPSPTVSSLGYHYYITFVDAYSRFTWIYLLKSKSDAFPIFQQFKTMVELQLGYSLKSLQTDWGGEFRPFTQYLTSLGITHRLICPHTHHQNGVIERKHRHVVDLGLTLLSQASPPLKYWDHAFLASV